MEIYDMFSVVRFTKMREAVRNSREDVQLNMKHLSYSLEVLTRLHVSDKLQFSLYHDRIMGLWKSLVKST